MKCTNTETNREYAVKILNSKQSTRSEARALKICRNQPHIIQFVEVLADDVYTYIVTELLKGNELSKQPQSQQFTESEVRAIFTQLVNAVKFMHKKGIIHRDLKLENIMLADNKSNSLDLKIVDFGFACQRDSEDAGIMSYTLEYVAPEVLNNGQVTEACDLWSLGVILYTLLCGRKPFHTEPKPRKEGNNHLKDRICKGSFDRESNKWNNISDSAKDLINGLLTVEVGERLNINDVAKHDWLINNVAYSSESAVISEAKYDIKAKVDKKRTIPKNKPKKWDRRRKRVIKTDLANANECDVTLGGDMEIEHDTCELLVNGTDEVCLPGPDIMSTEIIECEISQEPQSSILISLRNSEEGAISEFDVNRFSNSTENRSEQANRSISTNSSATATNEPYTNDNNGIEKLIDEPLNNNDKFVNVEERLSSTHSAIIFDDQIGNEVIIDEPLDDDAAEEDSDFIGFNPAATLLSVCMSLDISLALHKISKDKYGISYSIIRQRSTSSVGSSIKDLMDVPSSVKIGRRGRKRKRSTTTSPNLDQPAAKKIMTVKSSKGQPKRITRSLARRPEIHAAPLNLDISVS